MTPHPSFKKYRIPYEHTLGTLHLKALTIDDLDRDFEAVMESATNIKAANPKSSWPDGLTRRKNLIDLAWHQREFEAKRSFAWVIEDDTSTYLGCLYVYPSMAVENSADVVWWWRTGAKVDQELFRKNLKAWIFGENWPSLHFHLQE